MRPSPRRTALPVSMVGPTNPSASDLPKRGREAFARDLGGRKVGAAGLVEDLEADQVAVAASKLHSRRKALQAQLARIGAAVDLAVEEHVAGLDAQAVGGGPAAVAQAFVAPGVEQLLAQRRGLGGGDQQFVAELAAEADAPIDQISFSRKRK